jgi:hypothetical protein
MPPQKQTVAAAMTKRWRAYNKQKKPIALREERALNETDALRYRWHARKTT